MSKLVVAGFLLACGLVCAGQPSVVGLQMGTSPEAVWNRACAENREIILQRDSFLAFTGALVPVDKPLETDCYFVGNGCGNPGAQLYRIVVYFDDKTGDRQARDMLERFDALTEALSRKYGSFRELRSVSPRPDGGVRLRSDFRHGRVFQERAWETDDLTVRLAIHGAAEKSARKISCFFLEYVSKVLYEVKPGPEMEGL